MYLLVCPARLERRGEGEEELVDAHCEGEYELSDALAYPSRCKFIRI